MSERVRDPQAARVTRDSLARPGGLRRALISVMTFAFAFARIGAAVAMHVEDY
jgi:hypothetical protein